MEERGVAQQPDRKSRPDADQPERPEQHDDASASKPTDFLANERTFLAWIRTGIALVALGFVVARFGLLLRELAQRGGISVSVGSQHASSIFGAVIVLLAAILLVLSYLRYRHVSRMLTRGEYHDDQRLTAALGGIAVLVALVLVVYLLVT